MPISLCRALRRELTDALLDLGPAHLGLVLAYVRALPRGARLGSPVTGSEVQHDVSRVVAERWPGANDQGQLLRFGRR